MSRTTFSGPVVSQNGFAPTVYTSATLPAASSVPSGTILEVDDGAGPVPVISNGTAWTLLNNAGTSRPVRCATFGNSIAELNPPNTDASLVMGVMGVTPSNISPERWQVNNYYPNCYIVANGGVSGATTGTAVNGMRWRATQNVSPTRKSVQDVIDLRPDVVFLPGLDINDFASLDSANYRTTVDTTIANHRFLVQQFLSAGIYVVDEGNYPYSATGHTNPALTRQAILETNAIYAADAALYAGRMTFLNSISVLGDATANYLPNCSQNDGSPGLHPSFYGQSLVSQLRARALTARFGVSRAYRYAGTNLLTNAATAATGNNSLIGRTSAGVGGGLYATGWVHGGNGNMTQNLNAVQVIDGKLYSTMLATNTAANAQQRIDFPIDVANFGRFATISIGTTSGSPTITSASNAFTQELVGTTVVAAGVNAGTTILSVSSTGTATLSANATATATVSADFTITPGDILGLEFDLYVSDANDGPPPILKTTTARFTLTNNVPQSIAWVYYQNASSLTARSFTTAYKAHIVFPPFQVPVVGTLTTAEMWCEWRTDEIVQWKIGAANPRLVRIGRNGVLDALQQ